MPVNTAVILATFRVVAPELSAVADDTVNALSSLEGPKVSTDAFGEDTTEAIALRVAHILTLQARDASMTAAARGPGAVTSIGTGDLSVSRGLSGYTARDNDEAFWSQTGHGLRYLSLRSEQGDIGPFWAG